MRHTVSYAILACALLVVQVSAGKSQDQSASASFASASGRRDPRNFTPSSDQSKRKFTSRPFDMAISLRGNFSLPFGDYYEGLTGGLGFEGDFKICVGPDLSLLFMLSRSGAKVADDYRLFSYLAYPYVVTDEHYDFMATRYYVGLQTIGPMDRKSAYPSMWYAWLAVGAVQHQVSGAVDVLDAETSQRYRLVAPPSSDTRFGQAGGVGYIFRLDNSVGVDLSCALELIWTKRYTNTGSETVGVSGYSLDLKAGLTFLIGAKPN